MAVSDRQLQHAAALKRQNRREQWSLLGLAAPALVIIVLVILIPVGWLFYLSFLGDNGQLSFEHYQKMLKYKSYARTFVTTFQVSILTTVICILIGYPLAYFLAQLPSRLAGLFMLTVLLPFWTSLLVRTYAWLVLLQRKGILNDFAIQIGLWDSPVKLVHNMTGTLIGMAHIMLPFLVLPLYNAMKKIFYVTPAVLGGGRVIMVATQITAILENQYDWGAASALGVVLLVATVLVLVLAARLFRLDSALFGKS